jgi:hypothetical protein
LKDNVKEELKKWRFTTAQFLAFEDEDISEIDNATIDALATLFGNSGWFEGAMGVIVGELVDRMTGRTS